MMTYLKTKLKNLWARSRMTEYEVFLSQAVDLADLEHRMKYGYNRKFTAESYSDNIKTNPLFYTRGF
jgi:hypothetical protein